MALIKCPKCGREMSDRAACCPQCGLPIDDVKAALQSAPVKDAPKNEEINIVEQHPSLKKEATSKNASTIPHNIEKKGFPIWTLVLIISGVMIVAGGIAFFVLSANEDTPTPKTEQKLEVVETSDLIAVEVGEEAERSDNNNNRTEVIDEDYIIQAETNQESDVVSGPTYIDEDSIALESVDNDEPGEYDESMVFQVVQKDPEFPGGTNALYKYMQNNIQYPQLARENNITGRVYVTFIVEKDGSVSNVRVLRDIGGGCGQEAVRVVKSMPKWTPGQNKGKNVRVQYNLPINFTFNN